jgi:hypothetical protein
MPVAALDIDGLIAGIDDPSRGLAEEAARCLRAGAYRACIVATWSAVVFDVIAKVEALDALGDPRVKAVQQRIGQVFATSNVPARIQLLSAFESDVPGICENDLQIVSDAEAHILERIKEERNFCAHPSFNVDREVYRPSYEQALAHLTSALTLVLARQPLEGGPAVDRACNLISSLSFPENVINAERVLRDPYHFGRVGDIAARNVILKLFKGLVSGATELEPAKRRVRVGLLALCNVRPGTFATAQDNLEAFISRTDDAGLLRFIGLCGAAPIFTRIAGGALVDRIRALAVLLEGQDFNDLDLLPGLMSIPALQESVIARLQALSPTQTASALAGSADPLLADLVVKTLVESSSWGFTEDFINEVARAYLPIFTLAQFEALLTGARENSRYGGWNQVLGTTVGIRFLGDAIAECNRRFGRDGAALETQFKSKVASNYLTQLYPPPASDLADEP